MAFHSMSLVRRLNVNFLTGIFSANCVRCLSVSSVNNIKQILKREENGKLIIEGSIIPSDRANHVVQVERESHPESCYLCKLNLNLKHTDVLILSQFLRSDGCMLPRRVTGLCKRQQKYVGTLVTMAQKAGLMSSINPPSSNKDPRKRYKWKKWNTYWDESTIKY